MASNPQKPLPSAVGPSSQGSSTGDGLVTGPNGVRYYPIHNPVRIPISRNVADHLTSNGYIGWASGNSPQPQSGQTSALALSATLAPALPLTTSTPAPPQTPGNSELTSRPSRAPRLSPVIDPSILLIANEQRAYSRIANPTVDETRQFQQRVRDIRTEALARQRGRRETQGQQGGQDQKENYVGRPPLAAASSAIPTSRPTGQVPLQWMPSFTLQQPPPAQSSTSGPTEIASAPPQPTFVLPGTTTVMTGPFNPSISQPTFQTSTSVQVPMQTYGNASIGSGPTTNARQPFGSSLNGSSSAPICSGISLRNVSPNMEWMPTPGSKAAEPAASFGQPTSQWAGSNDRGLWPAQEIQGRGDNTSGAWNLIARSQTLPQLTPFHGLSDSMGTTEMARASGSAVNTGGLGEYNHPAPSVQTASSWTSMSSMTPACGPADSTPKGRSEIPQHWWDIVAEIDSGDFIPRRYYSSQEWSQIMAFRDSLPGERLVMGNLPPDGRIPIEWRYIVEQMDRGVFGAQRPYTHHEWWHIMAFRNNPYRPRGLSLASPPPLPAPSLGTAQPMGQQASQQPAIQGQQSNQQPATNDQSAPPEPLGMSDADINILNRQFIIDGNSHVVGGEPTLTSARYPQLVTIDPTLPGYLQNAQFQTVVDQRWQQRQQRQQRRRRRRRRRHNELVDVLRLRDLIMLVEGEVAEAQVLDVLVSLVVVAFLMLVAGMDKQLEREVRVGAVGQQKAEATNARISTAVTSTKMTTIKMEEKKAMMEKEDKYRMSLVVVVRNVSAKATNRVIVRRTMNMTMKEDRIPPLRGMMIRPMLPMMVVGREERRILLLIGSCT